MILLSVPTTSQLLYPGLVQRPGGPVSARWGRPDPLLRAAGGRPRWWTLPRAGGPLLLRPDQEVKVPTFSMDFTHFSHFFFQNNKWYFSKSVFLFEYNFYLRTTIINCQKWQTKHKLISLLTCFAVRFTYNKVICKNMIHCNTIGILCPS